MFDFVEFPVLPIVKVHLIINCALAFLTVSVVVLRLVSRFTSGAGLWWDDYLIMFALPQGIGMLIIQGLCKHLEISLNNGILGSSADLLFQGPQWESASM
jgi:hypothetical protein